MLQTSLAYVADVMCTCLAAVCRRSAPLLSSPFVSLHRLARRITALLGSFKALLESFVRMHDEPVPEHLDAAMMVDFLQRLYLCPHYVVSAAVGWPPLCPLRALLLLTSADANPFCFQVKMFSLRWTYECLDFFPPPTRAAICGEARGQRAVVVLDSACSPYAAKSVACLPRRHPLNVAAPPPLLLLRCTPSPHPRAVNVRRCLADSAVPLGEQCPPLVHCCHSLSLCAAVQSHAADVNAGRHPYVGVEREWEACLAAVPAVFSPLLPALCSPSASRTADGQLEQPHDSLDGYRELPLSVFHEGEGDELAKLAKSQR